MQLANIIYYSLNKHKSHTLSALFKDNTIFRKRAIQLFNTKYPTELPGASIGFLLRIHTVN